MPDPPPGAIPPPRHPSTPQGSHHRRDARDGDAHTQRASTTNAQRRPHPHPSNDEETAARAWGRAQAAAAPGWSAAKRARMARAFGLTLPEDNPPNPTGGPYVPTAPHGASQDRLGMD